MTNHLMCFRIRTNIARCEVRIFSLFSSNFHCFLPILIVSFQFSLFPENKLFKFSSNFHFLPIFIFSSNFHCFLPIFFVFFQFSWFSSNFQCFLKKKTRKNIYQFFLFSSNFRLIFKF